MAPMQRWETGPEGSCLDSVTLLQYSARSSSAAFRPDVVYAASYFFVLLFVISLLPFL